MKRRDGRLFLCGLLAAAVLAGRPGLSAAEGPAPTGLMCELMSFPDRVAIHDTRPEFSWIVESERPGEIQTAYQIAVADSAAGLTSGRRLVWDSGKIRQRQNTSVSYGAASPLAPDREYWWRVRTWDRDDRVSAWSDPQRFRVAAAPAGDADPFAYSTPRYPVVQTEVAPVGEVPLTNGNVLLDFGRVGFAGLKITVTGPETGGSMTLHLGEARLPGAGVNPKPGGSIRYHRAVLTLMPGRQTYTVPLGPKDHRLMTPEIGPVMPFRYLELEAAPAILKSVSARQSVAHYPFNDMAARFTSSDPELNAVWELCRYTMKATSFGGVYIDGDRERLPYEADALINQLGHYATDREFTLARYSHEYLLKNPTWPTEWILQSPLMAWADYLHTGDTESLQACYDLLSVRTLRSLAREDGLISTQQPPVPKELLTAIRYPRGIRDIVDWPAGERDGYQLRPVNTVVNAFHCRALDLMSRIAGVLGKTQDQAAFRAAFEKAKTALNTKLWDPATGLYLDGEGATRSSLHANMFPLALDLVPEERVAKIGEFLVSKGMACSVYGAQFLLEALYRAGHGEAARKLYTAPGDRSWAHMVKSGTTITYEAWDNRYKPNQDWNHPWGAAPANLIPRGVMGIEPLTPGFATIRVRPQPGSLTRATLHLPTIRGTVKESFHQEPDRMFELELTIPANMRAEVWLPDLGAAHNQIIGVTNPARRIGKSLVVEVGSGQHKLTRTAIEQRRR